MFPSFAEGFGLPVTEAAALGVPVVCNDLPVLKEILGDIPIYADVSDSYSWKRIITEVAFGGRAGQDTGEIGADRYVPPSWESHFNLVLKIT